MTREEELALRTGEGLARFLTFIDAIVAIAVTLLVLPLVEIAGEATKEESILDLLGNDHNKGILISFLLSFVVIARLWLAHHRIFERVARYDQFIVVVTLGWALTIVVLPFPTALVAVYSSERQPEVFYIGVLLLSSLCLSVLSWHVSRHPELQREEAAGHPLASTFFTSIWYVAALLVAVAVPSRGYTALLLLLLSGPTARLWYRWRDGRQAEPKHAQRDYL